VRSFVAAFIVLHFVLPALLLFLIFGAMFKNFYKRKRAIARLIIWFFALFVFLVLFIVLFSTRYWTFGAGAVTCFLFILHLGFRNLPFIRKFQNSKCFRIFELCLLVILTGAIVLCILLIYENKAEAVLKAFGFITFIVIAYSLY